MHKLKYVDYREFSFPFLKHYRGGLLLPSGDNIIKVTDDEKRHLMKFKNGSRPVFEEVKSVRKPPEQSIEVSEE